MYQLQDGSTDTNYAYAIAAASIKGSVLFSNYLTATDNPNEQGELLRGVFPVTAFECLALVSVEGGYTYYDSRFYLDGLPDVSSFYAPTIYSVTRLDTGRQFIMGQGDGADGGSNKSFHYMYEGDYTDQPDLVLTESDQGKTVVLKIENTTIA